ncbi:diphthamide biosynthesis protein 3-like isoform X1 [Coffea arabica]|uniref:Diphthamide biosynthesis protein 3 n=2 Tax=Coffea arabica TaxID=13443 RepID=A0ABM4WUS4_COFAR|nr:diphthamide biosynthesis protein 3-like isoform X1 [Coffea arabica]
MQGNYLASKNLKSARDQMSYDDVEIEDMEWNEKLQAFTYPCPCGDLFQITKKELRLGEEIARCPSCSLYITVIYNTEDFADSNRKNKNIEPPKRQPVAVT